MNRGGLLSAGLAGALTLLGQAGQAGAQICRMRGSARAELPISEAPDAVPFTWIAGGRIVAAGMPPQPLALTALVETGSEPSGDAATLTGISGEHMLEPLEVRGEWMRVVLKQPSDYCSPDVDPVRTEGWVRWISSDAGPELWYYTRGC